MTDQETFDIVARHLYEQGQRSYKDDIGCRYRDPHGRKCAVGVLIPDALYHPNMETVFVSPLLTGYPVLRDYMSRNVSLLADLQFAHDAEDNWDESGFNKCGADELRRVAIKYSLNADEVRP